MQLPDFKLERYFDRYEFNVPYLMCCSDCESFSVGEILAMDGEEAVDAFMNLRLCYTEARGNPELRHGIADFYSTVGPDEVLVFSGAEEAIFVFMNAALSKGDHVIVQYPCYQSLFEVARAVGCEITEWAIKEGNQGWETDLDNLAGSIKDNTRAIIINSPHNPTGYLLTRGEMETIVELARERDILLFSDEVYRHLEYDAKDRLEAACDGYENAVSLGVMSKTYGLPGLRIGWIATRNAAVYKKMASFKDYTTICNSAPAEFLATTALKHRKKLAGRNLGIIRDNLVLLDEFFASHAELFYWPRPKAGPIAFPGLRWGGDAESFCRDLVREKGVLLLPSACYEFGHRHLRLGFGRRSMADGLEKLAEYVEEKL
ncbi:MAG TPA: aminotransferase class V-fold PLP-dependent enzyme [Desulfotomaculum sp.]|nr:MAG: aminotransferase [Peptococcaceae bacterium BRH_c8a]KJS72694.1 MAG: aminotransferase [Desulfotomaculum sp. BICA1-6]HBX23226.1 aminotransferase class V-fold PLP-dependent enzyme [Desulfotomaculum sp.]